jgi:DNA-binding transcriptional ArsR family regulator
MAPEVGSSDHEATEHDFKAELRAIAHPIRLRILSLLTGAPMSATDIARELKISHANASYHLRRLLAVGTIVIHSEEKVHGGVVRRYRYDVDRQASTSKQNRTPSVSVVNEQKLVFAALAGELVRRSELLAHGRSAAQTDAEVWLPPEKWEELRAQASSTIVELHRSALPPHTPGSVRVSATVALFVMEGEA